MRAYRVPAFLSAPEWQEVPEPTPGPGQVVVEVTAVGLCHSDIGMLDIPPTVAESLGWTAPFTLGHEIAGRISALGAGVHNLALGTAVILASSSCGNCWYCVRGHSNNCIYGNVNRGAGDDGGLAPYVLVKTPRDLLELGDLDPVAAAPLTDAGATAYHGVNRVRNLLEPGSTAVVFGAGGLGSFAVQLLRVLSPAKIIAFDPSSDKRSLAMELGAHLALPGVSAETVEEVRNHTGGRGADAVLDFVGTDATIGAGVSSVRPGGAYGLVGAAGGTLTTPGGWYHLLPKDGEIFTYEGSSLADAQGVLALARSGLISSPVETFAFDDVEEAYRRLRAGTLRGRAVVTFD